tara:strand:- start:62722 stop:63519 length:798 start_codon:yes stop_codon:yes gene_type:complete
MKNFALFLLFALVLNSCGPSKYLPKGAPESIREKDFFRALDSAENKIQSLSFKANASFEQYGRVQSFKLEIRILKDSIVWLDISDPFLGIKLARAVVFKDSIAFINKIQKQYFTGRISKLNQQINLPIDFKVLQNMLMANMIFPISKKDFQLYFGINEYILADYEYRIDSIIQNPEDEGRLIKFYPEIKKPKEQTFLNPENQKNFHLKFMDFKKIESLYFPQSMKIEYEEKEEKSGLELRGIKNLKINLVRNLPFSIPSNYERMP